jgi:hypothetical protein
MKMREGVVDHRGQVLLGRSPHVVPVLGKVRGRVDRRQGLLDAIDDVVHVLLVEHRVGAGAQPAHVASDEVLPRVRTTPSPLMSATSPKNEKPSTPKTPHSPQSPHTPED